MSKTCHKCNGRSGDYKEADLKRCAGCRKVYYCSTACQKGDWVEHIFDCKPRRPVTTADYLARAVYQKLFPEHFQTCEDYGFNRVFSRKEKTNLLGLYMDLTNVIKVPSKTIHDWRTRGVLANEIKAAFYQVPEYRRGVYFRWFLENEHVITQAGQPLPDKTCYEDLHALMVRTWRFIGGSEKDSVKEISVAIESKPDAEKECWLMYTIFISEQRPFSDLPYWVDFGFAACTSPREEIALFATYQKLIDSCTFKEFCKAFRAGRLLDLFSSKGLQVSGRYDQIRDLLRAPPHCKKSVWYLKQFILRDPSIEERLPVHPAVREDYGFVNCRNDAETRQLKRVYKAFFDKHKGDPLALHEAAMKGDLHSYLSDTVEGLRDPKFRRLMKNSYLALEF